MEKYIADGIGWLIQIVIIGVVTHIFTKIGKLEDENTKLKAEIADQQRQIDLNSQRDKLTEEFYEKTVGKELQNMEKSLGEMKSTMGQMQTRWENFLQDLMKK